MKKYDVVVLGGGPGGYTAAIEASKYGKKTALIEARELGGTCLNRGCIPTKAILESSSLYAQICHAEEFGVNLSSAEFDFKRIQARKNRCIEQLRAGVAGLMRANKIDVINGHGDLMSSCEVIVNGESILFDDIILAMGSKPSRLPIPGIELECVINSDEFLELQEVPESVVIVGGGVIGVEFATALIEFGCKVTVIEFMDTIIPMADAAVINSVTDSLKSKGVKLICGGAVKKIFEDGTVEYEKDGNSETVSAEKVIFAAGRTANTDTAALDKLGIKHDRGRIVTDKYMKTNLSHVYACGDVNGKAMLAHTAMREGIVAARNIAGIKEEMSYSSIPSCIYLHPQAAWTGITEQQARAEGKKIKIGVFQMRFNGKALVSGAPEGFIKVIADAEYDEVIGVHIVCKNATEMICCAVLGMSMEATLNEFANIIYPHPTMSESIGDAAAAAK